MNPRLLALTLLFACGKPQQASSPEGQKTAAAGGDVMIQDLKLKNGSVYVGPLKIGSIGRFYWPVVDPRK